MSIHVLYAYAVGADLTAVEALLVDEFKLFVQSRHWARTTWVVNQRHPLPQSNKAGDLPLWDLGLNHELPDPGTELPGWFDDIDAIAVFLGGLSERSGRRFVIGIGDTRTGATDDLFFVNGAPVDLVALRAIIGDGTQPSA